MPEFNYQSRREMEPRPGRRYATVYLHQTAAQRLELFEHVNSCVDQALSIVARDAGAEAALREPLTQFRRESRGEYYSAMEIMLDLWHQLDQARDPTQAMVNRWNRLFEHTPNTIDLVQPRTRR